MSASNPSRIPFAMMSAGLPVVELYLDNNLYDFPENGCLLADPSPEGVATALLKILNDKKLQESMSKAGQKFMQDYPIEKGYAEFLDFIEHVTSGDVPKPTGKQQYFYKAAAITPSKEVVEASAKLPSSAQFNATPTTKELIKKGTRLVLGRTKGYAKRKLRSAYRRIRRLP